MGVNIDLTPLNNKKYFLIQINIIDIPGATRSTKEKYFNGFELINNGLRKEY